jgi:hypothetical protein
MAEEKLQDEKGSLMEAAQSQSFNDLGTIDKTNISLFTERLVVQLNKRKIGEIVVRKQVETQIIEVPVQRERLIVEQVSPVYKQLAEIGLEEPEIHRGSAACSTDWDDHPVVSGFFSTPEAASQFLSAIAGLSYNGCGQVELRITLSDSKLKSSYERWLYEHSDVEGFPVVSSP